jgi:hypothetical protein
MGTFSSADPGDVRLNAMNDLLQSVWDLYNNREISLKCLPHLTWRLEYALVG